MAFLNRIGNLLKQNIGKHVSSNLSASNPSLFQAVRSMSSSSKLFVGGLSYSTDEMSLREAFSQYGEVVEARIIMDRETGRSRGFAFITFTSTESASSAIQAFDGQDLHGRRIRVNYATEKPRGGGFGGGFGGPGGGFNYGGQGGNYNRGGGYQGGGGYGGGGGGGFGGYGGGSQYPDGGYQGGGGGFGNSPQYPTGGGGGFGGGDNYPSGSGGADYLQSGGNNAGTGGYYSGNPTGFAEINEQRSQIEDFKPDVVDENGRDGFDAAENNNDFQVDAMDEHEKQQGWR
ncbi:glycine-rich RNA-binding protein 2, mitochondrial-like [Andrographis paniculata]|uniref:glycine-rich RNA-binding protein 2, mitochondrial-like n=1 Tax=Andrographis paniculata TaxID=175694 RepID=UPI0021E987EE|nr:glycine-rich RNA-binding protein 2, mitochondrial-like [Andrographis paniculata]XP_051141202.1 glycine-rich RNA-binding protein 2, mitochondrial-like [Andrographis paniculata]XP_051141203.1 glycine-rich RNA-binding protein 2, mitochondrial-like [Andrographis paniculata]